MSFEDRLRAVQGEIPGCVAVGYVDIASGRLMALRSLDSESHALANCVAATTADLFMGPSVSAIERIFMDLRCREEGNRFVQDIAAFSETRIHIFLRGRRNADRSALIVCRSNANLGLVLARARSALPTIEACFSDRPQSHGPTG